MAINFVIFILLFPYIFCEKCIQKGPCLCEYEDGHQINITQLENQNLITSDGHNLTYYFHPCFDTSLSIPKLNYTVNECQKTSLCLVNTTSNATAVNLGYASEGMFKFGVNSEKFLVFTQKKHNITTIIHLGCLLDYPDPIFMFKNIDSKTAHNLVLASNSVCPILIKHTLSTGSVLVILFLTFSAAYLLGGAAVLYFLRGARGKEMIPNYEFWSDLPNLVRDGAVFLQNGCKPTVVSSDSYDRI